MFVDSTFFSSVAFLTNSVTALYKNEFIYSLLFVLLFISSIWFRLTDSIEIYIFDQICIYSVVLYGAYVYSIKQTQLHPLLHILICSTFVATILLFHYGFYTSSFCYDLDKETSHLYHSLLHIVSSIGHHLLILIARLKILC